MRWEGTNIVLEWFSEDLWNALAALIPKAAISLTVLVIGWVVGRLLGRGVSKALGRVGVDKALRKTVIGKAIERSGVTCIRFFDLLVRWFVYVIAILAVVDVLEIEILANFVSMAVGYLPTFIAGIFILVVGFVVSDFIADTVRAVGREVGIGLSGVLALGLRLFMYFVVFVVALTTMKIDVTILQTFANALAWGIAIGIAAGIGIAIGLGFKDTVAKNADKWIRETRRAAEKANETSKRTEDFWNWYTRSKEEES
jgi:hypothetical protein